jgi:hypothetical protein
MNKLKNFTINFSTREVKIDNGSNTLAGTLDSNNDITHITGNCSDNVSGGLTFPINGSGGFGAVPPQPIIGVPANQWQPLPFPYQSTTVTYPKDYVLIYTDKGKFENFNLKISVEYSEKSEGGKLIITKEYCLSSIAHQSKLLTFTRGEHFNSMHFLLLPSQQYLFTIQDADIVRSLLEGGDQLVETHEIIFKKILMDETARDFLKVTLNGVGK